MKKPGYAINRVNYRPPGVEEDKTKDSWEIIFMLTGSGSRRLGNTYSEFSDGDLIVIPPQMKQIWEFDYFNVNELGKLDIISITIDDRWLDKCIQTFEEYRNIIVNIRERKTSVAVTSLAWLKTSTLMKESLACDEARKPLIILKLLKLIGDNSNVVNVSTMRNFDTSREKLRKIKIYVNCNFRTKISLDEVAGKFNMSKPNFCIFFKKYSGRNFTDYVNGKRVQMAKEKLVKTSKGMAEIGAECGFQTTPYFNRIFKKHTGETPKEYRLNHK